MGMSNFTTTLQSVTANTFPLLVSKHKLASLSSLWIMGSLPETKPQIETIKQKTRLSFCWISFHAGDVPGFCTTARDCYGFLFNEMTTQQHCICKSRCCNRLDYSGPKVCKRGLSATAVSKVWVLRWAVNTPPSAECAFKMTIWIKKLTNRPSLPLYIYWNPNVCIYWAILFMSSR